MTTNAFILKNKLTYKGENNAKPERDYNNGKRRRNGR